MGVQGREASEGRAGQNGGAWIDPEALGASWVLGIEDATAKDAEEPPALSGHRQVQWREVAISRLTNK